MSALPLVSTSDVAPLPDAALPRSPPGAAARAFWTVAAVASLVILSAYIERRIRDEGSFR